MRYLTNGTALAFFLLLSLPLQANSQHCLDTNSTQEFATYIADALENGQTKELRACFNSLNSDSKQIDYFSQLTEAMDPSNRFKAGTTVSIVALYSTEHQENDDKLFAEFLSLVRELEDRLTQTDPNEKVMGLREQMLDMQDEAGGSTVFHHVVTSDHIRYAEILWEAGADIDTLRNNRGETVAERAAEIDRKIRKVLGPDYKHELHKHKVHEFLKSKINEP